VQGEAAYRRLFTAHVTGLVATGVATVALALLVFELAEEDAGAVLGTALAIKMAANVVVTPVSAAFFGGLPRRAWLIALALFRAGALLLLPFVDAAWQVWVLVAVFQAAAANAAIVYQATVPELLPDEVRYARAISKSKIASEAETLLSPLAAAVLLLVLGHRDVFVVSVVLFAASAVLLHGVALPRGARGGGGGLAQAAFEVFRLVGPPAMRGALLVGAAGITVVAMVTVNTVVLVRGLFGLDDSATALALAAFGGGGIAAALALPGFLAALGERTVMLRAGSAVTALLAVGALLPGYLSLLALWVALGVTTTLAQLPVLALIRRIWPGAMQGVYSALYAVTHAVQLVAYLAAGWVGAGAGLTPAFLGLAGVALVLVLTAARVWRPADGDKKGVAAAAAASLEPVPASKRRNGA
jgi:hypothetical protein